MIINKLNVLLNSTQINQIDYTITRYIKIHIMEMESITIRELADACFVSQAMISKYCRKLGYDNFKHLKDECREYIRMRRSNHDLFLFQNYSLEECSKKYVEQISELYGQILAQLDFAALEKLVDNILKCHCLFLYGKDYDQVLCRHMQYRLDIYGVTVVVVDESMVKSYVIKPNSMVLIFYNSELMKKPQLVSKLIRENQRVWFVTEEPIQGKEDVSVLINGTGSRYIRQITPLNRRTISFYRNAPACWSLLS